MPPNELTRRLGLLKADAIELCVMHEKEFHAGRFCPKVRFDLAASLVIALAKDNDEQYDACEV